MIESDLCTVGKYDIILPDLPYVNAKPPPYCHHRTAHCCTSVPPPLYRPHQVYEKGAEVIRLYHTLLGKEGFRKGGWVLCCAAMYYYNHYSMFYCAAGAHHCSPLLDCTAAAVHLDASRL